MPGDIPRPRPALGGQRAPWSALLVLLLTATLACTGGAVEARLVQRPPSRPKPHPIPEEAVLPPPVPLTPAPTPEPTPDPTPPPPPPTAVPELPAPPPPPPPPPVYVPPPASSPAVAHNELSRSVTALINDRRIASGLPAVSPNGALNDAAQRYAELLFSAGPYALSHTLDGTPSDRAARAGYSGGVGEVLATGQPSSQQIIDLWMASPAHQSIIMGGTYSDIGVGCAVGPAVDPNGNTFETAVCVGMLGIPY